jgi:hypothetical protein
MSVLLFVAAVSALFSSLRSTQAGAWPNRNPGPGCSGIGCHNSGATIHAEYLGGYEIRVEVEGASSPVAGEIIRSDEIIEEINSTSNPFILHVTDDGTYTINAGLDNSQNWGTTTIDVTLVKVNYFSWGALKKLFR